MTNKRPGRIGDSPVIGAGTYADDRAAAVSATGHGEMFLRVAAAHEVCARMRHGGASLQEAAERVVHEELPRVGGQGGLIAVDARGQVVWSLNTEGMYRGQIDEGGSVRTAIFADEEGD
jgi:beta-aspartyl-peptidase (threonine type)